MTQSLCQFMESNGYRYVAPDIPEDLYYMTYDEKVKYYQKNAGWWVKNVIGKNGLYIERKKMPQEDVITYAQARELYETANLLEVSGIGKF